MPLRNQPYLPLYVQDFLTDEKLIECSASATGVYIRLMCVLHKGDQYGKILLKQKYKQSAEQVLNFACQLAKHFPYDLLTIQNGLRELLSEKVIHIEGDFLFQKRMVKDSDISDKRASSGSKGGQTTIKNKKQFAKAKRQANTEIDIANDIKGKGLGKPPEWESDLIYPFLSDSFQLAWKAHREMRGVKDKAYLTRESEQASLVNLSRISKDEQQAISIIQRSLANGWPDFYKEKEESINPKTGNPQKSISEGIMGKPLKTNPYD